jgi:membrane protein implicated in regulation of membrane protease activity
MTGRATIPAALRGYSKQVQAKRFDPGIRGNIVNIDFRLRYASPVQANFASIASWGVSMNFISWLVFGVLFMCGEIASGSFYFLAIGLAFVYPAIGDLAGASTGTQVTALVLGSVAHALAVRVLRGRKAPAAPITAPDRIGERVEVIEWFDESSARVRHRGEEWEADKLRAEMPSAGYGIIHSIQGSRLIISTE